MNETDLTITTTGQSQGFVENVQDTFVHIILGSHQRCLTVAEEHHKHSCCQRGTRHSCCSQGNAQSFIKGKEVQLARDAGSLFSIGPELRRTTLAVKGTWERGKKGEREGQ